MKKKLLAALLTGIFTLSSAGMVVSQAAQTNTAQTEESQQEESQSEELKLIGEENPEAYSVTLVNETGKGIKEIAIKELSKKEYSENMLKEQDIFQDNEKRILYYKPSEEQDTEEQSDKTETEKKDEIPMYDILLTFEDDTTAELHTFPFGDIEEGVLKLEDKVAYLVFQSVSLKKEVNTLDTEKSLLPKPAQAASSQTASQSYDYSQDTDYEYNYDYSYEEDYDYDYDYEEDYDYDYGEDDYDTSGEETGGDEEGTGGDGCLDNGLLN